MQNKINTRKYQLLYIVYSLFGIEFLPYLVKPLGRIPRTFRNSDVMSGLNINLSHGDLSGIPSITQISGALVKFRLSPHFLLFPCRSLFRTARMTVLINCQSIVNQLSMSVLIPWIFLTLSPLRDASLLRVPLTFPHHLYLNRFIQIHSPTLKSPEDIFFDVEDHRGKTHLIYFMKRIH